MIFQIPKIKGFLKHSNSKFTIIEQLLKKKYFWNIGILDVLDMIL
jgi:hypothetical protein